MKKTYRIVLSLFALTLLLLPALGAAASGPTVLVLTIDGPIAPAAREYLRRGIQTAELRGAELLVLQLNTPGGAIDSMTKMASAIRTSSVPVVVYVTPRGGWAASAGAVITLAGHAAAMAPETAIGAASPVGSEGEDLGETMEAKVKEGLTALIRSLTTRRPEKAQDLAEAMINEARAVSADEALEVGLIDFIADDLQDLLAQLDGFTVQTVDGERTLHTAGAQVAPIEISFIEELLGILTNSNIVFLLLSIGVQAILIELSSPGGWVAGFIGAICLALAAFGLGFLPVNWFGIIFIVIAFVLFIVDIKAPTHGGLTAAGIGSFILGALVLFNSPGTPSFQKVSLPLVITVALVIGLSFAAAVGFSIRALKARARTGAETLAGAIGVATSDFDPRGQVQSAGELWTAEAVEGAEPIRRGDRVEVIRVEGLRLKVKKKK